ncbi:hexose transporter [Naematelia encephala]|uniref:Hexose transporter n=1 Tax=Naematelia encephala TaxID=71784 RepID=A0A1Y2B254_9TREE|nr:hexose transporter [Naematelia encephala]
MEHAVHTGGGGYDELARILAGRNTSWYRPPLLKLSLICFLLLMTSMNNGYDGSMMNGLQSLDTWKDFFNHPHGSVLGVFNAIQSIGGIVGLPFGPIINDRYGRRWTMFIGAAIQLVGVALQTAAQNVGMFIGCRFLIGFGLAFSCLAAPTLVTELAFPTHRGPMTSLYNSTWYLGSIVAAWTTYGTFRLNNTWGWRIPSVLQGLPSLVQLALIFFIPESPRWLVDHGRDEHAIHVLAKYHCNGDSSDPLVAFEYNEIKEANRIEREANKSSTYLSLFRGRGNIRRMRVIIAIAFFSQWSGNGIVSYYLNIALNGIGFRTEAKQTLINGILQVFNLATAYLGALVVDKAGRRVLWLVSTGGMCLVYMWWTIANGIYAKSASNLDANGDVINPDLPSTPNKSAGNAVLAAIFLYYAFYNLAMSPLLVSYTVEILPFRIRSKGLMVMQMCVNLSLVFNQYVNPVALDGIGWKLYIVYTVWIAFEFVYLWFTVIETKGKNGPLPLEEIAQLFDGDEKVAELEARTAAGMNAGPAAETDNPTEGYDEKGDEKAELSHVEKVQSLRA